LGAAVLSVSKSKNVVFNSLTGIISDYMVYTRGSKEDFDRWAKVTGDDGWSWDNLVPYMKKVILKLVDSDLKVLTQEL
jgi:hypothetical protein